MGHSIGSLTVSLLMLTGQFETDSGRAARLADRRAKEIDAAFAKAGRNIGIGLAAGFGIATTALGVYIKNAAESERVQAQLTSRITDTSGAAQRSLAQLNTEAQKLMKASIFDDEAIGGAQAILLTFKKIQGVNFDKATAAVLDLSTAMGTDLNSAALQLGKALNDPIKGLAALGRAGIQFSADQTKTIKTMVDAGNVADAQRLILKELEGQMGTAAEAARDTLGGAVKALGNSFDNLMEGDAGGAGLTGVRQALESMIDTLNDPDVKRGADATAEGLLSVANAAIKVVSWVGNAGSALAEYFGAANERSNTMLKNQRNDLEGQLFAAQRDAKASNPLLQMSGLPAVGTILGAAGWLFAAGDLEKIENLKKKIEEIDSILEARSAKTAGDFAKFRGLPENFGLNVPQNEAAATAATNAIKNQTKAAKEAKDLMGQWAQEDRDTLTQEVNAASALQDQWDSMVAQLNGPADAALYQHQQRLDEIAALGAKVGASAGEITAAINAENAAFAATSPQAQAAARAAEEFQWSWLSAVDSVAHAFGDWMTGTISSFKDFGHELVNIAKRWASDVISQGLSRLFNGGFAQAGTSGSGSGSFISTVASSVARFFGFGSGAQATASGWGGATSTLAGGAGMLAAGTAAGSPFTAAGAAQAIGGTAAGSGSMAALLASFANSGTGQFLQSSYAPWLAGAAGAVYGYKSTDDPVGKGLAGAAYGVAGYGVATGVGAGLAASAAGAGAGAAGAAGLAAIPVVGWIALAAIAVNAISGGKLFGTKYKLDSATNNFSYGDGGIGGSQSITKVRQKALFGGRKWTTSTSAMSAEAQAAMNEAFSAIDSAVTQAATQLGIAAPDLIGASFKQEFDKKGNLKSEFGTIAGRVYKEAQDAFNQRYLAENLLNVAGLSSGHTAAMQQLANGYRGTPEALTDFATLMLAVAGDAKAGKLLWDDTDTALVRAVDTLDDLRQAGESLAETYKRVSEGARAYGELIAGVRGALLTHGLTDYAKAQLQIEQQYRAQVKQANDLAKALGLSGARAEDLAAIEMLRAQSMADLQQQMEQQRDQFLGGLRLSDLAPGTDQDKLTDAMGQLQAAVAAGDLQQAQQLAQSALGFGRNLYASGSDYNALYGSVTDLLNTLDPAAAGLTSDALQQLADTMQTLPDDIAAAMFDLLAQQTALPPVPASVPPPVTPTSSDPMGTASSSVEAQLATIAANTAASVEISQEALRTARRAELAANNTKVRG